MKAIALAALLALAVPAEASVTTYYWHQTSASIPGLVFTGQYSLVDGSPPVVANSTEPAPFFGGLLSFSVQGGGVTPVTLADLTPACSFPDPTCVIDGFPAWSLSLSGANPSLSFIDVFDSYDYTITPLAIAANTDAGGMCGLTGACVAGGYWSSSVGPIAAPAPATLPVMLSGLLLLLAVRGRRDRIRS